MAGVEPSGRYRSVSATSLPGPLDSELRPLLEAIKDVEAEDFHQLQQQLTDSGVLQRLRYELIDNDQPREIRDSFRRGRGFEALLDFLHSLCSLFDSAQHTEEDRRSFFAILSDGLSILVESLRDQHGNRKYFMNKIHHGGWSALERSLTPLSDQLSETNTALKDQEHFYGALLATAIGEDVFSDLYTSFRKKIGLEETVTADSRDNDRENLSNQALKSMLNSVQTLQNSDIAPLMLHFLYKTRRKQGIQERTSFITIAVPYSLRVLAENSRQNLVALHTAGLLSTALEACFDSKLFLVERKAYRDLAILLCEEGINNLEDASRLYAKATNSSDAAAFILEALRASRSPPSIHFDLTLNGYSCAELPSLGRSFPPTTSGGYTLAIWAKFLCFDSDVHTTMFGAFDVSQTCFILAYLEKDTRNFILQTSIRGSRPSVRFRSTAFELDRWYHIAIVHKRPRPSVPYSRASLFVDGEFCEQVKATYPLAPSHPSQKDNRIQAFFGTPQNLTSFRGNAFPRSKWSLASSVLLGEALSDDLVAVLYHLGPKYFGNFQDCLGTFQTYRASAALNLRNENLHLTKDERSDIMLAIRKRASDLIPESLVIINISPGAVLDGDDRNNIDESQLVKSLSKSAARSLMQLTRSGANAVAINGALPAINDALTQQNGVAVLVGDPVVAVPQALDDASWRIGGCGTVVLPLVSAATTPRDLAVAVEIVFESIKDSWRNSEAMESQNGYAILASLIRDKLGFHYSPSNSGTSKAAETLSSSLEERHDLALKLLKMILDFLGFVEGHPLDAVLNNPLAYRVLLIDCDVWRNAGVSVQKLYYEQFVIFGVDSHHHRFNSKRLARMRLSKKLLEGVQTYGVSTEVLQTFLSSFRSLLSAGLSTEMLRHLALFVTYCLHQGEKANGLRPRKSTKVDGRFRRTSSPHDHESGKYVRRSALGLEVLRIYTELLCSKRDLSVIKKFAKTVTNKWLLYLMSGSEPEAVVLATRILARLLVLHGHAYITKFAEKSGGFTIMRHRLKRWWHLPSLWPLCFAMLFDRDIADLDLSRPFDLFGLIDLFSVNADGKVVYPQILPVIVGMLGSGLKAVANSKNAWTGSHLTPNSHSPTPSPKPSASHRPSMSSVSSIRAQSASLLPGGQGDILNVVTRFLADVHSKSQSFRDFTASSNYTEELLFCLFPVVVGSDTVSADLELNAHDSKLTIGANDILIRPLAISPPTIRTTTVDSPRSPRTTNNLRRGSSSFVLVSSSPVTKHLSSDSPGPTSPLSPISKLPELNDGHSIVQNVLEIAIAVFIDQILARKDFPGLGLFLKSPPSFHEHQTYFDSWILRNTLSQLNNTIMLEQKLLWEPRVLTNLARFFTHVGEALYEGWFVGGAEAALDFAGSVLEYLQRPDISNMKSIRLCNQAISSIREVVFRTLLLTLSTVHEDESLPFLEKLTYWQTVLLSSDEGSSEYLPLICYLLYDNLVSSQEDVRKAAANLWRIILVQKPGDVGSVLGLATTPEHKKLASGFEKLVEIDNETFLIWIDDHRHDLDILFHESLSKNWDTFVAEENAKSGNGAKARVQKRQEKLRKWNKAENSAEDIIRRHEVTYDHWTSNIFASETMKLQRALQDQQDDLTFSNQLLNQMERTARGPIGFLSIHKPPKWRLDQTEGRNRMRLRVVPDADLDEHNYQPKRKPSTAPRLSLDTKTHSGSGLQSLGVTPNNVSGEPFPEYVDADGNMPKHDMDESFELIEEPNEDQGEFEDKNRKVMRSLSKGDQVQNVSNVSRIVGLEAVEGLLILGKDMLYLLDNYFQRSDGEIVNVWQAPSEERDPYVRMISGHESVDRKMTLGNTELTARSWKWNDVISISKRRFLFRDVALEIFFADGRSYLLTVMTPTSRNELYGLITAKSPQVSNGVIGLRAEDIWRFESLRITDDQPQSIGSRFANVFGQGTSNPATRKWVKGELSNFHYLMLVNTMAGRTFNDLTQYPVFPWVLADYTSEELDLSNPKTFRDLSKPMGCQTLEREAEYKDRYQSFAEMADHNSPPFHYGTHYSSAMIVTSYLIRLQPFVKSYLLLQGGNFDHADRMFYSIEKAWNSASRINMTDVRELIPEFYYLPEFLVNANKYDFGTRQGSEKAIDSVDLPPWAKGDPKIFIAKHREALESPYVSENLHKWIDLVFGFKQKGEAAFEAVNVFHHLSYQGGKDLDNIEDPIERLATIGIIHNFGQTPFQVFQRPHPAREEVRQRYQRLDTSAESLTRLPGALLESHERIASLSFSLKQDKLLCSAAFRLNIPPNFEKYMEWGFADGSVRFYAADSKRLLGHLEHLHIGQLSCGTFADSSTLITSGTDCTIIVWNVVTAAKEVDITPRQSLLGHRSPINILAVSRSFSTLLSASTDGQIILWDLNRLEFVRELPRGEPVDCAKINDVTGNILLCRGPRMTIYTLNGDLLVDQKYGTRLDDSIMSCAFYEGAGNEWLERDILFTGHKRGIVRVWNKTIQRDTFTLDLIRELNHVDNKRQDGANIGAGITCILPMPQVVYTGDEDGTVVSCDSVRYSVCF